ncbi:MAG: transporter substrate-binding domain-containing protein, partial [Acidobacteria bacterium]
MLLPLLLMISMAALAPGPAQVTTVAETDEILDHVSDPWTGDLDGITRRGFIRILTVHNPLFFTFDGVEQRGLAPDIAQEFQKHLDEQIGSLRSPTVVLIPVARDELLPGLIAGRGDIAAGNLTITPERSKIVDFASPTYPDINELVITGPAAAEVSSFDDLVAKGLHLRRSSSYFEHMKSFNDAREKAGKKAIPVETVDEYLEDHDLLDLVNASLLPAIVVDSHKAKFWAQVFPNIN